jgi:hypothetical protein
LTRPSSRCTCWGTLGAASAAATTAAGTSATSSRTGPRRAHTPRACATASTECPSSTSLLLKAGSHQPRLENRYISICIYYKDHSLDNWHHHTSDSDRGAMGVFPQCAPAQCFPRYW